MGQSPDSSSYNTDGIGVPLVQGNADIQDRTTKPQRYTSLPSSKYCDVGDTLISVRAPVGSISKSIVHACIGRGIASLGKIDNFLYQFFLLKENSWGNIAQGSTFSCITAKDIENLIIGIPTVEERNKIGSFLALIDERIQTQNKIIEALTSLIKQLKVNSFSKMKINGSSYYFEELFIKYSKNNIMNYPQYSVGKYGIKSMEQSNLYSTNNHIVFEPNSLILGIGIDECGVSKDLYGCCSPIYKIYKINNEIIKPDFVDLFIGLFLQKKKNFISQKSTRREYEIVYSLLDKTLFCIPSINGQEKIVFPIEKLIKKLNLEKEILNKYVEEKNYLLANLFI